VLKDNFKYVTIDEGVKLYKMANGISGEFFPKSLKITLPFCANDTSRILASIGNLEVGLDEKDKTLFEKLGLGISAQYGKVDVNNSTSNYSMNFIKLSATGNYKINTDYFLTSSLSVVQFRDIEHSENYK